MKSDKRQSMAMISLALIVIGGILVYAAIAQPRVYEKAYVTDGTTSASTSVEITITNDIDVNVSVGFPINLNTATVDELMVINGIGESIASSIVEYRNSIGGYSSVDEIKQISGIGEQTFSEIEPYLTV